MRTIWKSRERMSRNYKQINKIQNRFLMKLVLTISFSLTSLMQFWEMGEMKELHKSLLKMHCLLQDQKKIIITNSTNISKMKASLPKAHLLSSLTWNPKLPLCWKKENLMNINYSSFQAQKDISIDNSVLWNK